MALDDVDAKTGQRLLTKRLEWVFGFPSLPIIGDGDKIGLESINKDVTGTITMFTTSLTTDSKKVKPLLDLLWAKQETWPETTLKWLDPIIDVVVGSPFAMDYFARMSGMTS
mmetsp:Transcript_43965/g.58310  ORF Transcript_43965/g.58310 Transcript_43965/m.58310 type:complete len:112 (+) Transcript_43965:2027-2362(+)|eukprot:CAMPEP_0185599474 /NCGR_PEP_ID=MMETSP0434-20130131/82727_1 /TAXON_ID=626734 ORGANISM="Favella taraikaensis, Strain Fe Narragansett Bay" /NCGR_SAMPLE_ID=MMETSP0434 /ASSEMBLY_ACC=CAM_ASM_000379 /LENGTH=111 /DNA_ID=CAMNT_0028228885 /DNA_START=2027 /DNA_END=2362 /DNA_ORIENTATION=+